MHQDERNRHLRIALIAIWSMPILVLVQFENVAQASRPSITRKMRRATLNRAIMPILDAVTFAMLRSKSPQVLLASSGSNLLS